MEASANTPAESLAGNTNAMTAPNHGPYVLSGPIERPDLRNVPTRGDVAHIGLAGRYFVPYYAVPQPRSIMPGGASLLATAEHEGEVVLTLDAGDTFEVLDISGGFAWGCMSLHGPVGYIPLDRLEPLL